MASSPSPTLYPPFHLSVEVSLRDNARAGISQVFGMMNPLLATSCRVAPPVPHARAGMGEQRLSEGAPALPALGTWALLWLLMAPLWLRFLKWSWNKTLSSPTCLPFFTQWLLIQVSGGQLFVIFFFFNSLGNISGMWRSSCSYAVLKACKELGVPVVLPAPGQ